jgi:hypothetical protein
MDVDSILHIDCKHENIDANDNDLIKKKQTNGKSLLSFGNFQVVTLNITVTSHTHRKPISHNKTAKKYGS